MIHRRLRLTALVRPVLILLSLVPGIALGQGGQKFEMVEVVSDENPAKGESTDAGSGVPDPGAAAGTESALSAQSGLTGEIEPNGTRATATPIVGTQAVLQGNIFPAGDIDYYSFTASAGSRIYVATMGGFSANGNTGDTVMQLEDSTGAVLEIDDDDGTFGTLSSTIAGRILPAAGTYYVRIIGQGGVSQVRPYRLYFRLQSGSFTLETEPNDTTGTAMALPASGWITGTRGSTSDVDLFSIPLAAGDTVFVSLDTNPERDGTSWSGRAGLGMFGDLGDQILLAADSNPGSSANPPSQAFFMTVKSAGTYYVAVDSSSGTVGGPLNTYLVSVTVFPAAPLCTTYTSTDVPKAVGPGAALTTSTITVPVTGSGPRIADLDVSIQLNHAIMADVDAHLRSPGGNDAGLFTDIGSTVGGSGQTLMDLTLDDEAGIPIGFFNPVKGMACTPERSYRVSWFDGENAAGVWSLDVRDDTANGAGGNLTGWSMTICEPPAPPVCSGVTVTKLTTDFETGDAGFTHSAASGTDNWQRGLPSVAPITTCNSGTSCWKTNLAGAYSAISDMNLLSPSINLSGVIAPITATWAQKYQMENALDDHAFVEIREVGGANPRKLFEFLDDTQTDSVGSPPATIQESAGWGRMSLDISSYVTKTVELRFHLDSNSLLQFSGLAIDDVTITGCCTAASCDDSNPCSADVCDPVQGCIHSNIPDGTGCSDGLLCTTGDACTGGVCQGGPPPSCDDGLTCTSDFCNVATQQCEHPPLFCDDGNSCTDDGCNQGEGCVHFVNDDQSCSDGNACTTDACVSGVCVGTESVNCADTNPCTDDSCDPATGLCVHVTDDNNICDDGNPCTNDACVSGYCTCPSCLSTLDRYVSSDAPKTIPSTGTPTVTSILSVSGAGSYILDIKMNTFIQHTASGDLQVTLTSPSGTIVTITSGNGGTNDNVFNRTLWSDKADPGSPVPYGTTNPNLVADHIYTNLVRASPLVPEEAMGAFNGENPNGVWILTIADTLDGDGGSLDGWGLNITTLTAPPTSFTAVFTNTTPVGIMDPPAVETSTLAVSGVGLTLGALELNTHITHTWNADLDITLTSPSGTIATITTDNGDNGDVFNGTLWDDNANPGGAVPYAANNGLVTDQQYTNNVTATPLASEEALSAFRNEDPNGLWTLTVSDDAGVDTGTLASWSLTVTTISCPELCPVSCDDGNSCTADMCDPASGCVQTPVPCDDGNACTDDSCDQATGACIHTQNDANPCSDGNGCTLTDSCVEGICQGGNPATCNDSNPCTNDSCNPANGACIHTPNTNPCNDSNACTQSDMCANGVCVGGNPVVCNDSNQCTNDSCTPATGLCSFVMNTSPCNDGNPCTQSDVCANGACVGSNPVVCNDNNACTNDSCTPATGLCVFVAADSNPCSDGSLCTTDHCASGTCVGVPIVCNDSNACTDDACNPATGLCVYTVDNTNTCSDGNACTVDVCSGGSCACPPSGICAASPLSTFTNATPLPIPDNGSTAVTSTITVAGAGPYLYDLNMQTFITHTALGFLEITLKSPAGTVSSISTQNGSSFDNVFNGTVWDDQADPGNQAPFPGNTFAASNLVTDHLYTNGVVATPLVPEEAMGGFIGENPNGVWTISIRDTANNDTGTLTSWSLTLKTLPQAPAETTTNFTNSTAVPISALTASTITSTIFVSGLGSQLGTLKLATNITHTSCSDLDITLASPAGTVVTITTDNGGALDNLFNGTQWSDKADPDSQIPYGATNPNIVSDHTYTNLVVVPQLTVEEAMAAFQGENPNGTWTLTVSDDTAANGGSLNSWTLMMGTTLCAPACAVDCDDQNPCTDDTCNTVSGCVHTPNTSPCNDGNLCTQNDTCSNAVCAGTLVVCTASDQCHTAGTCNAGTGACTNPAKADGSACNDGSLCTQTDTCQAGVCTGSNPVVCTASDQCHTAGTCNAGTGACSNPAKSDGSACNDGNACTQTDTCQTGVCTGSNPVVCTASDQCHTAGTCNTGTGVCTNPAKVDGSACNDGNACTQTDTCQAGVCTGSNPVVCTPSDQCHNAGTCNSGTGVCSNPAKTNGTACNDGNACTQTDTCQTGVCTGANPVVCTASDQCHNAGTCNTGTGVCTNPAKADGSACSDGNACTQTDTCQSGVCTGANPVVCTASDQCHTAGTCNTGTGVCTNPAKANGTACNDANLCTQTDTCQAGVCTGSNPVVCTASDQCHNAGTCNSGTGICTNPAKANGTACNDASACTQTDTCQSGICTGSNPVICTASDQCHDIGTCDSGTGICSNPAKANGAACNDTSACTQTDTCQAGTCTGANPVVCTASDQCHDAGTCNPGTGLCSNPAKADGTDCDDADECTQTDKCQAGTCTGSNPVVCTPSDQCHNVGTCSPGTGLCSNPAKANGTACSDGNPCTQTDTCQTGICTGANPVVCTASDQCHTAGTCNSGTGLCSNPAKADGASCNDSNGCTQTDTCQAGTCTGANPVVCTASDQCHTAGTCSPGTGLCSNPAKADGTVCNDANACTQTDTCQTGTCTGANPVVCTASDQCHTAGTCSPGTGLCSNPAKADGTACSDGNLCTQTDTCQAGTCTGGNPVVCTASDQCHDPGTCAPGTGLCSNPAKANGAACSDGNSCTQTDTCQAGTCSGANPVVCTPDQCHNAGTCAPGTGLCSNPPIADGTACNDGTLCTQLDTCQAGICTGSNPVICTPSDQCHNAGTCNSGTGACSNPAKADGSACNDANACTQTDTCQSGTCTGANPVVCTPSDQCHSAGTCSPPTGLCSNPAKANGTGCNDANACTRTDTCQSGTCTGANPVVCTPSDQCHNAGTCSPLTGLCSNPAKANGTGCNDANACTQTDTCQSGTCTGANPVVCTPVDQCHNAGTCSPGTGLCTNPPKQDGMACDDLDPCSAPDVCTAGVCAGGPAVDLLTITNIGFTDKVTLVWDAAPDVGLDTVYDVPRGLVKGGLPVGSAAESCAASGVSEATAVDPALPALANAFWYLVRGRNLCGDGSYGVASSGEQRVPRACP